MAAAAQDAYTWEQNHDSVIIKVQIPESTTKSDVKIKVKAFSLHVVVAGNEVCSGELAKEVDPEEMSWIFETRNGIRYLIIDLPKVNRTAMKKARIWPCLWKDEISAVAQQVVDESLAGASAATTDAADAATPAEPK